MTTIEENRESALYALLNLGIQMESDDILEIVTDALNNLPVANKNRKRVAKGKVLFDEMFNKGIDENQLVLPIDFQREA